MLDGEVVVEDVAPGTEVLSWYWESGMFYVSINAFLLMVLWPNCTRLGEKRGII